MVDNQLFASPLRSLRQPKRTSNFTSTIESGFDKRTITIIPYACIFGKPTPVSLTLTGRGQTRWNFFVFMNG